MKNSTLTKLVIATVVLSSLTFLILFGMIVALLFQSGSLTEGLKTIDTVWNKGFNMTLDKNKFEADQGSMALLPTNFLTDSMNNAFSNLEKNPEVCDVENLFVQGDAVLNEHKDLFQTILLPAPGQGITCPNNTPCVCPDSQRTGFYGDTAGAICDNACDGSSCETTFTDSSDNTVNISCGPPPSPTLMTVAGTSLGSMNQAYDAWIISQLGGTYANEASSWTQACLGIWNGHQLAATTVSGDGSVDNTESSLFDALTNMAHRVPPGCDGGSGSGSGSITSNNIVLDDYLPMVNSTGQYVPCEYGLAHGNPNRQVFQANDRQCIHGRYNLCGKVPIGNQDQYYCVGHLYDYSSIVPFPTKGGIKLPSTDMLINIPPMKD
jgi:hypothetical protein